MENVLKKKKKNKVHTSRPGQGGLGEGQAERRLPGLGEAPAGPPGLSLEVGRATRGAKIGKRFFF